MMDEQYTTNYHEAVSFAIRAHAGQLRKYTGDPYIIHLFNVSFAVSEMGCSYTLKASIEVNDDMIIAALLHDVLEDTDHTESDIESRFGNRVLSLVVELTDVFTKEGYPRFNRATRKAEEVRRLSRISPEAAVIKVCDIADNTRDIVAYDPKFAKTYLVEKAAMLEVLEPKIRVEGE